MDVFFCLKCVNKSIIKQKIEKIHIYLSNCGFKQGIFSKDTKHGVR